MKTTAAALTELPLLATPPPQPPQADVPLEARYATHSAVGAAPSMWGELHPNPAMVRRASKWAPIQPAFRVAGPNFPLDFGAALATRRDIFKLSSDVVNVRSERARARMPCPHTVANAACFCASVHTRLTAAVCAVHNCAWVTGADTEHHATLAQGRAACGDCARACAVRGEEERAATAAVDHRDV